VVIVELGRHGAEVLAPKHQQEARRRAEQLEPVITELQRKGMSLAKIASERKAEGANATRRAVGPLLGAECYSTPPRLD
jgi:hypothetical protein